jgi:hypothetical protein
MKTETLTLEVAQYAADEWGFNCGPAALCAMLDMTPDELRPHLLDFESKGYTNPTLMADILRGLGVRFRRKYECAVQVENRPLPTDWPSLGLVRIQWGGPWTREGVPMRARYRHTHWIGARLDGKPVFDVNALCVGGWISWHEWKNELVPWLIRESVPKGNGEWWPTHCWEIER